MKNALIKYLIHFAILITIILRISIVHIIYISSLYELEILNDRVIWEDETYQGQTYVGIIYKSSYGDGKHVKNVLYIFPDKSFVIARRIRKTDTMYKIAEGKMHHWKALKYVISELPNSYLCYTDEIVDFLSDYRYQNLDIYCMLFQGPEEIRYVGIEWIDYTEYKYGRNTRIDMWDYKKILTWLKENYP